MGFPVDVTPRAPLGEQNAPGCTPVTRDGLLGAGVEVVRAGGGVETGAGAGTAGWGGTTVGAGGLGGTTLGAGGLGATGGGTTVRGTGDGGAEVAVVVAGVVVVVAGVVAGVDCVVSGMMGADAVEPGGTASAVVGLGTGPATAPPITSPTTTRPSAPAACSRLPTCAHPTRPRHNPTTATTIM